MHRLAWTLCLAAAFWSCSGEEGEGNGSPCGDIFLDNFHCGTCDNVCVSDATCFQGECLCPAGESVCGESCVDLANDVDNCGVCGTSCDVGSVCVDGVCGCPTGREACGDRCIDVSSHSEHCGECGYVCPVGARCAAGACRCREGEAECDDVCADVLEDENNCGGCGIVCQEGTLCEEGECRCRDSGALVCDGVCLRVTRDPDNCGDCGFRCPEGASCQNGSCLCSSRLPDVCDDRCVDTKVDRTHCGGCGQACVGEELCVDGDCKCAFGRTLCGEVCVDVAVDEGHCGGCDTTCVGGQSCCNGACEDECEVIPVQIECQEGTLVSENNFHNERFDRHALSFELPEGVTSFMIVPYTTGRGMLLDDLQGPGGTLNMLGTYGFANANSYLLGNPLPLLVPQTPGFANTVAAGPHTLNLGSHEPFCHALIPKVGPGTQLDLNLYFVGVNGLNADNFETHTGLQSTLDRLAEIFAPLDVTVQAVSARDVEGEDATRFEVLRSIDAVHDLVSLSVVPGEGTEERLSLNVFFIDHFAIPGGNILGVSSGIPGAAGLHGMPGTGVVVAGDLLSSPLMAGQVTAHELGHFLGLFHTTEIGGGSFDPLTDTNQCARNLWSNPGRCPDISNMMFPFVSPSSIQITDEQASVIHANPLVR